MQRFSNNWLRPIELAQAAIYADLDLPDGTYRLTLTNAERSLIEYIDATVLGGGAELARGLEGSTAQAWPEGSVVFCGLTAATLGDLLVQVQSLAGSVTNQSMQIADLTARIQALEPPGVTLTITVGLSGDYVAGFGSAMGSCSPSTITLPGGATATVSSVRFFADTPLLFSLIFVGNFPPSLIAAVDVQGVGRLEFAANTYAANEQDGSTWNTVLKWETPSSDWFASAGADRLVTIEFAT